MPQGLGQIARASILAGSPLASSPFEGRYPTRTAGLIAAGILVGALVGGCPDPTVIDGRVSVDLIPQSTADWALTLSIDFEGDLRPGQTLDPGKQVSLRVTGADIPPEQMVLWVGDYLRLPFLEQQVIEDGRLTSRPPRSSAPAAGETITLRTPLPLLYAGTYDLFVGDLDGPRSNVVQVEIHTAQPRLSQEEAAALWSDGLRLMAATLRAVAHDPDENWQAFWQEGLSERERTQIDGVFDECERLAQLAGQEYLALDADVERQLQALLWNSDLLPMFAEMRKNANTDLASAKRALTSSLTFMSDGLPSPLPRRPVHRVLFKLDVIGARLQAIGAIADIANIVAIVTGGEGLAVTIPATLAINGLRLVTDAILPTETVALELQGQDIVRSHPESFSVNDFDSRWIYWATMAPPMSLADGVARLGGETVAMVIGHVLPAKEIADLAIEQARKAGLALARQFIRRLGVNLLALFPVGDDARVLRIKTVADTTVFTHPLDSTDAALAIPLVGEALEYIGDYFLNWLTDPAMTVESPAFPDLDVRGWRELTEEHLAIRHPGLVARGQTDEIRVSLTAFRFGVKNLALVSVPWPEFLDPHVATTTAMYHEDYNRASLIGRRAWHFDTLGPDANLAERAVGTWVTPETSTERRAGFEFGREYPLHIEDVPDDEVNQSFMLEISINGGAPLGWFWAGEPGAAEARIPSALPLRPGLNTVVVRVINSDARAADRTASLRLGFPGVLNPELSGGRTPATGLATNVGPDDAGALHLRLWAPPAFEP